MSQQAINKLSHSYDPLGRLTDSTTPYGGSLDMQYDTMGNRVTETVTAGSLNPPEMDIVCTLPKRQMGDFINNAMVVAIAASPTSPARLVGWGNSTTGTLANNNVAGADAPAQVALFDKNTVPPPAGTQIVDWAFTNANLYVVYANGWVYSAGRNDYGQLGQGDNVNRAYLKRIEYFVQNNISVTKVWAAGSAALAGGGGCAYFQDGNAIVYGCGANAAGNLANAVTPTANVNTPAPCAGLENTCYQVVDVVIGDLAGNFSAYMPCSDGRLMVAGYNGQGQLGVTLSPVAGTFVRALQVTGANLANVVAVSATGGATKDVAGGSALVLDKAGNIWTTGYNGYGQLGLGDTVNRNKFNQVTTLSNIAKAEIGGGFAAYCYAQDNAGVVYTWGFNAQNNLFLGNVTNLVTTPNIATFLPDAVDKVLFPKEDQLGGNAQMIILTVSGRLAYAGIDNGQPGVNNDVNPGAFKWLPVPSFVMNGLEQIADVFVHGTGATQRLFITTNLGRLFASGYNADSVCTGGYSSNIMPANVSWYRVTLSERLLSC